MLLQSRVKGIIKPLIFRAGRRPRRIRFGPGKGVRLLLDRQSNLQRELGLHEIETHGIYRRLIGPSSVIHDVGAADGDTALMFAQLASRGETVAFEPEGESCTALQANLALNPDLAKRVRPMRAFLGAEDVEGDQPIRALDSLVSNGEVPSPTFVKIDVDGGELDVLRGMSHLLATARPAVLIETHSLQLEKDCTSFLRQHGYEVSIVKNAWWRAIYPELRPGDHNRWLAGVPAASRTPA